MSYYCRLYFSFMIFCFVLSISTSSVIFTKNLLLKISFISIPKILFFLLFEFSHYSMNFDYGCKCTFLAWPFTNWLNKRRKRTDELHLRVQTSAKMNWQAICDVRKRTLLVESCFDFGKWEILGGIKLEGLSKVRMMLEREKRESHETFRE